MALSSREIYRIALSAYPDVLDVGQVGEVLGVSQKKHTSYCSIGCQNKHFHALLGVNILSDRIQMFKNYPDVLSVKDLQSALNIGKSAAYSLLESGQVPSFRIGRVFKIPKSTLIQYVKNQSC